MYKKIPVKRYQKTLDFIRESIPSNAVILDLGVNNPFAEIMREQGWKVKNTQGEDLDVDQSFLLKEEYTVATAFEILEHTLNPYTILSNIKAQHMFVSVPLKLWFAKAYQSKSDPWDRHFHEFEDWQFDWLVEKTGWEIVRREKWKSGGSLRGFRPVLRLIYPRYYMLELRKKQI